MGILDLVTAGLSAGSALFGGETKGRTKEKTKTKTRQQASTNTRSHLGVMVKQAEKYGFNPLTVLSAGGLGAFSESTTEGKTKTKSKMKGKNVQSSNAGIGPAIAAAVPAIGNALSLGSDAPSPSGMSPWYDYGASGSSPIDTKLAEYDLINAQLRSNPGYNATGADGDAVYTPGSALWWKSVPWDGMKPEYDNAKITNPHYGRPIDASRADASASSDRYDEIGGAVHGISNYAADRRTAPTQYDAAEQQFIQDAFDVMNAGTRNIDKAIGDWEKRTFAPGVETIQNKARSYWDAYEDAYDGAVAEVRSTLAPYVEYQFQPAIPYGGRVDNRGYPRTTW